MPIHLEDILAGTHISHVCKDAAHLAILLAEHPSMAIGFVLDRTHSTCVTDYVVEGDDRSVSFKFNEVVVIQEPVSATRVIEVAEKDGYWMSREEYVKSLAAALEQQFESKMEAARVDYWTPERLAEQAVMDKAEKLKMDARAAVLATASTSHAFVPTDAEGYAAALANQTSDYGKATYRYAEDWATLMNAELAKGSKVEDIAQETSNEADVEGITGFMYGAAVAILARFWEHGEELRRWHNLGTQIGTEGAKANESGGVLNPALLRLGTQSA